MVILHRNELGGLKIAGLHYRKYVHVVVKVNKEVYLSSFFVFFYDLFDFSLDKPGVRFCLLRRHHRDVVR